jgi:hypothetical protein
MANASSSESSESIPLFFPLPTSQALPKQPSIPSPAPSRTPTRHTEVSLYTEQPQSSEPLLTEEEKTQVREEYIAQNTPEARKARANEAAKQFARLTLDEQARQLGISPARYAQGKYRVSFDAGTPQSIDPVTGIEKEMAARVARSRAMGGGQSVLGVGYVTSEGKVTRSYEEAARDVLKMERRPSEPVVSPAQERRQQTRQQFGDILGETWRTARSGMTNEERQKLLLDIAKMGGEKPTLRRQATMAAGAAVFGLDELGFQAFDRTGIGRERAAWMSAGLIGGLATGGVGLLGIYSTYQLFGSTKASVLQAATTIGNKQEQEYIKERRGKLSDYYTLSGLYSGEKEASKSIGMGFQDITGMPASSTGLGGWVAGIKPRKVVESIPIFNLLFTSEQETSKVRQQLVSGFLAEGYPQAKAESFADVALRRRTKESWARGIESVALEKSSEFFGRLVTGRNVMRQVGTSPIVGKKVVDILTMEGVKRGAYLGGIEGGLGYVQEQFYNEQKISPLDLAANVGFGAATAAAFSYGIGKTTFKPVRRGIIEGVGNVLDPFEYVGDVATDLEVAARRNVFGQVVPELNLKRVARVPDDYFQFGLDISSRKMKTPTFSFADVFNFGGGKAKTSSRTDILAMTNANVPTKTRTSSFVPTILDSFVPTNVPSVIPTFTSVPTKSRITIPSIIPSEAEVPAEVPTETDIFVPSISTSTRVNTRTISPRLGISPFSMPGFGDSFGGGGRKPGFKYLNELKEINKLVEKYMW